MLTIHGNQHNAFCDGFSRRDFLCAGALGLGGLSLPQILQAESALRSQTTQSNKRPKSVVMVYLPGGPTQHETFDPKPESPIEIRGSFNSIATQTPGVRYCELLPKLSAMSEKFSVIRSLVGMANRHESFQCYTGRLGGRPQDSEPAGGWPSFGSVTSRVAGPGREGMLPYVDVSPAMGYPPYRNRGIHNGFATDSWPGFTGSAHTPFTLEGNVKADLVLNGSNRDRLEDRKSLLSAFKNKQDQFEATGLDSYQQQAFGLLTSSQLAKALDVESEDAKVRQKYGEGQKTDPSFGGAPQSPEHFLLARRLVEAGVRCVTVAFGAWDWHAGREGTIEKLSKKYLPVFDHTLSVFLDDLEQRGLLDEVMVVVWGEFGRTPRINAKGGRDHWPETQSVLVAGGGIQGGQIIGETDSIGARPAKRPIHVQEVFATMYHKLGIDVNAVKSPDFSGRPRYLVDENRQPVRELL